MKAKLKSEMKAAMKAKDKVALGTIRAALSAIQYEEIQKGTEDLPEKAMIAILMNEAKKRRESIDFAEKAERQEQIEELQRELSVLESFLPQQLSAEKVKSLLDEFKTANPESNMGLAMKHLKDNYAGQYDGKTASQVAKELFT